MMSHGGHTCILSRIIMPFLLIHLVANSEIDGKMCSKKQRVEGEKRKVPQTRRIPAKCSNWDRTWTWITRMDCGTKYQKTYVELPTHQQYQIVYECCPGDKSCKNAAAQHDHESDERFLAITFGCASAAFIILVIIITVSVCRKRHSGFIFCPYKKDYETAEDQEPAVALQLERSCQNDYVIDDYGGENVKLVESEYEEICDINCIVKETEPSNIYQKSPSAPPSDLLTDNQELNSHRNTEQLECVALDRNEPDMDTDKQVHEAIHQDNNLRNEKTESQIPDLAHVSEKNDQKVQELTLERVHENTNCNKTSANRDQSYEHLIESDVGKDTYETLQTKK